MYNGVLLCWKHKKNKCRVARGTGEIIFSVGVHRVHVSNNEWTRACHSLQGNRVVGVVGGGGGHEFIYLKQAGPRALRWLYIITKFESEQKFSDQITECCRIPGKSLFKLWMAEVAF